MDRLQKLDVEQEGGIDNPQQTQEITETANKVLKEEQHNVSQRYNIGTIFFQRSEKEHFIFFKLSKSEKKDSKPLSVESVFLECYGLTRHLCHPNQFKKGERKFSD